MKNCTHFILIVAALLIGGTQLAQAKKKTYYSKRTAIAVKFGSETGTVQVSVDPSHIDSSGGNRADTAWCKTKVSKDDTPTYTYTFSAAPTNGKYGCCGWYTAQTGGNRLTYDTVYVETNVGGRTNINDATATYYARFNTAYTLKFDGNGSASGSIADKRMIYSVPKQLPKNSFKHTMFTISYNYGSENENKYAHQVDYTVANFTGWATSKDGAAIYSDQANVDSLTTTAGGSVTLYAKWKSDSIEAPYFIPEGANEYVKKWYYYVNNRKDSIEAGKLFVITDTITLYAVWTPIDAMTIERKATAKNNLQYTGNPQDLINPGKVSGGKVYYYLDGDDYDNIYNTDTVPKATLPGTYKVYCFYVNEIHPDHVKRDTIIEVTIAPANLSITAKNDTITYGAPIPAYNYDITGWVNGESESLLQGKSSITCTCNYQQNSNAGTYDINITGTVVTAPNYKVNFQKGKLVVKQATPTLTEPTPVEELKYDGTAHELAVPGTVQNGTLQYALNNGTYTTTVPTATDAGRYTVKYKVKGNNNYADIKEKSFSVTIDSLDLTITALNDTITYGDDAPVYKYSSSGWISGEDESQLIKPSFKCEYAKGKDVGTYLIQPEGADAKNYRIDYVNGKLEVKKATPQLTPPTAKENLKYNGTAQDLANPGELDKGTLLYALDNGDFAQELPKATDAGTYTVKYKVEESKNFEGIPEQSFKVSIDSADLTITALNDTITYGDDAPVYKYSSSGWISGEDESQLIKPSFKCEYAKGKDVGTYLIQPEGADAKNYRIDYVYGKLEVKKATPQLTKPTAKENLKYNGTAQDLANPGELDNGTLLYALDNGDFAQELPKATDAGTYTVKYKVEESKNFEGIPEQSFKVSIDSADLTITALNDTITYGDDAPVYKYSSSGWISGEDESQLIKPSFKCEYAKGKDVGTYLIQPEGADAKNYRIDYVYGKLEVKKATPQLTKPTAKENLKYNGTAQDLANPGELDNGTLLYALDNGDFAQELPKATDAGTYTVKYKVEESKNFEGIPEQSFKVSIDSADLTITALNDTITYGDDAPVYKYSSSGWISGEDESQLIKPSFKCEYAKGKDVGTYLIQPEGADAKNYRIDYVNGKLEVKKATPEVTPPTAIEGLKYTGAAQTMITAGYTTGGTLEYALDEQDYSPVLPTATAVGTYTVYYRVNGGTNYNDVGSDSLMVTIAEPDEPTALAPVQAPVSQVQKIIRHDQLIIIRDDNTYTIHGQRID